ncbi:MAG TPA: sigma factor, partial [Actinomycetota bacterium]|nr:sigma factor [Actinomycetota bacterium]
MGDRMMFEDEWPRIERYLRDVLARRRIPRDELEDVVQDTALRLFRAWDRVRPETAASFALTISLNLVRDDARRRTRRENMPLPVEAPQGDIEQEALARIELARVRMALDRMNESQRSVLLAEVGEATAT